MGRELNGHTRPRTLAGLAAALGLSRSAVHQWSKHPAWKFPPNGGRAGFDVAAVRRWRAAHLDDPRNTGPADADDLTSKAAERAARVRVLIEREATLKLDRLMKSQELVRADDVRRRWKAAVLDARQRFLELPRLLAMQLSPDDPGAVEAIIDTGVRGVLTRLSEQPST